MNNTKISTPKGEKYFWFSTWFVATVVTLSIVVYFVFFEYARYYMKALNCETLSTESFNESLSKAMLEPTYVPTNNKPTSQVHFTLDLGLSADGDTFVRIRSDAANKLIYRGPYTSAFTVQAGDDLLGANYGNGADNFSIYIHQKNTRKVCGGVMESIRPWQANKTVHIKLLPFRELNEIGLPETFKVSVE